MSSIYIVFVGTTDFNKVVPRGFRYQIHTHISDNIKLTATRPIHMFWPILYTPQSPILCTPQSRKILTISNSETINVLTLKLLSIHFVRAFKISLVVDPPNGHPYYLYRCSHHRCPSPPGPTPTTVSTNYSSSMTPGIQNGIPKFSNNDTQVIRRNYGP